MSNSRTMASIFVCAYPPWAACWTSVARTALPPDSRGSTKLTVAATQMVMSSSAMRLATYPMRTRPQACAVWSSFKMSWNVRCQNAPLTYELSDVGQPVQYVVFIGMRWYHCWIGMSGSSGSQIAIARLN